VHCLVDYVLDEGFTFAKVSTKMHFSDVGALLQADEEVFRDLRYVGVCSNTSSFINSATTFTFPINAALDLTFEVTGVLARQQGHLDVAMRVGLKFSAHGL